MFREYFSHRILRIKLVQFDVLQEKFKILRALIFKSFGQVITRISNTLCRKGVDTSPDSFRPDFLLNMIGF